VYSMGTIEHFADSASAAAELFRVLKPGGRAIVGVPNRMDPFLRPLLVSGLSALGLYDYGYERSFSRRQVRTLLTGVGFRIVSEPAILFIPGGLRMLDLWCHCRCPPLARVTALAVSLFVWLDRQVAPVRRYGYLLATVVVRPAAAPAGASTPGSGRASP
jgi:SAM-dependent methyltransferase